MGSFDFFLLKSHLRKSFCFVCFARTFFFFVSEKFFVFCAHFLFFVSEKFFCFRKVFLCFARDLTFFVFVFLLDTKV